MCATALDPIYPYFLKGALHWQSADIGIAMAASSVTAAFCQIPAGLLLDLIRAKRLLVLIAGFIVGSGCLLIVCAPNVVLVITVQAMLGAASAVIPPALAALSLGLVGRKLFPGRVSRNESFNHGGNFAAAILAGTIGQRLGYHWIFYLVCLFASGSAVAVVLIRPREIDHKIACGLNHSNSQTKANQSDEAIPIRELLKRRDLSIFLVSIVLFHFGNAAMLPMAGQVLARTQSGV